MKRDEALVRAFLEEYGRRSGDDFRVVGLPDQQDRTPKAVELIAVNWRAGSPLPSTLPSVALLHFSDGTARSDWQMRETKASTGARSTCSRL